MPHVDFTELKGDGDETQRQMALLPAWFTQRMLTDVWTFGLLLATGQVLVITQIVAIKQAADGALWLDVEMGIDVPFEPQDAALRKCFLVSPTERTRASVNAAHVVAAFDLAST